MPKSNYLDNAFLTLLFNGTSIPNLADGPGTAPLTSLFVALHTANPGPAATQDANEAAYPGYARVPVARSGGGWVVGAELVNPSASIVFPAATGGAETETYWSIGVAIAGATEILYYGTITPSIAVALGVTPELSTASVVTES